MSQREPMPDYALDWAAKGLSVTLDNMTVTQLRRLALGYQLQEAGFPALNWKISQMLFNRARIREEA